MNRAALSTLLLVSFLASCDDGPEGPPPPVGPATEIYVIRDVDYIHRKYFYFDDPHAFIGPRLADAHIKVYRAVLPAEIATHPEIIRLPAWMIADPVGDGQKIRDAAATLNAHQKPSPSWFNDVELLTPGEDYRLLTEGPTQRVYAIQLAHLIPDNEERALAVSYINMNDVAVGGSYSTLGVNSTGPDTLMLEMIKAPTPTPYYPFGSTWRLEVRNAYSLGRTNLSPGRVDVEIHDLLQTTPFSNYPQGSTVPYRQIFGLDLPNNGQPPDGQVDAGFVDFENGVVWFPSLQPFAPDPDDVDQWSGGEFAFTGDYEAQYIKSKRIYEERLTPTQEQEVHQYDIRLTRYLPSP